MMQPIHLREGFYAVEMPEDAEEPGISVQDDGIPCLTYWYKDNLDPAVICFFPGTWQIIGISKDLTEEQARGIVEYDAFYDGYKDYDTNNFHNDLPFISPLDSLHSLLTSKGLDPENSLIIQKM